MPERKTTGLSEFINTEASDTEARPARSTSRVVAAATGLMIVTILLSRLLGFVRESLLLYYFGRGALTADGIQWSAEIDTAAPDADIEVERVTVKPPALGKLLEIEFGLTAAFRAVSSATADLIYKWQARNAGGTWVDLHTVVTKTDIGITYIEETRSGRFAPVAHFNSIPFEVRLIIQCNEANGGRAKVKNSSYVRIKYAAS